MITLPTKAKLLSLFALWLSALAILAAPSARSVFKAAGILVLAPLLTIIFDSRYSPVEAWATGGGWPRRLKVWRIRVWTKRWWERVVELDSEDELTRIFAPERVWYFPAVEKHIQPTRLGNALFAVHAFGQREYGLNSRQMLRELLAVGTPYDRQSVAIGRSKVKFSVAFTAVLGITASIFLIVSLLNARHAGAPLMWAGVFAAGTRIQYCSTIRATEWLTGPIKALVNLRRSELAKYFDLTMPATLDEERDMWRALMNERIQHHPGPADWLGV